VNRIAQESLREVLAVVRGYRQADFSTELAGARGVLAAAGIDCRVHGDPTKLASDIQKTLGWVVREATTNVLRHSRAQTCTIAITQTAGMAILTVDNDGVLEHAQPRAGGMTAGGREHPGSGLSGLRERLVAMAGTLEAGPVEHDSFRLTASIPLQRGMSASPDAPTAGSDALADSLPLPAEQG